MKARISPRVRAFLRVLPILLAAGWETRAAAQEYSVVEILFLPPVYYVGDQVEMRFVVRSRFAADMTIPAQIPQPAWGRILDLRIFERGADREVRIKFIAFETGTKTFPVFNLGPLVLENLTAFVTSLLDEEDIEPAALRGQLLLPGTQVVILIILAGVLLLPVLWLFVSRTLRRTVRKIAGIYREGKPYRMMLRHLRGLRGRADVLAGREFYISLLQQMREYLSRRFQIAATSLTTRELEDVLRARGSSREQADALIRLFLHGDMVKFANLPSTITSRMSHLDQMEKALTIIETNERKNRQEQTRPNEEDDSVGL